MAIISEAEHILGDATAAGFDCYTDVYGEYVIPTMLEVGFDLLGVFRQVSGPMGRDLLIARFESAAAREAAAAKMFSHPRLAEGLPKLISLPGGLEELTKVAAPLPFADDRRLAQGKIAPDAPSRCYRLIRRKVGLMTMAVAGNSLSQVADALEGADSWKLLTAYATTTGDRSELSELWITDAMTPEWYPAAAPAEALAELDGLTKEATVHFLDPLDYSPSR